MGPDGEPRLFRPDKNMARLQRSVERLALPPFSGEALVTLIKKLVVVDKRWIPTALDTSLYIRPTIIGTRDCTYTASYDLRRELMGMVFSM